MKILVSCRGFIGDILFASSLAKKLKAQYPGCVVHYNIPLNQPKLLLRQNPYIDHVIGPTDAGAWPTYDLNIDIPEVDQRYPATIQMQAAAGIKDQSLEFDVWTVPEYDAEIEAIRVKYKEKYGPVPSKQIGWQRNWEYKAYQCTPELLVERIGAPHRDIDRIIAGLSRDMCLIPLGFDRHVSQYDPQAHNAESFARTASIIKQCDWFIGSEGGLSNLAAAVGTKCIITTDFIIQNYGPNGHVKQIANPQMGPAVYYPDAGHVHLDPCLTDDEIITQIREIISEKTS